MAVFRKEGIWNVHTFLQKFQIFSEIIQNANSFNLILFRFFAKICSGPFGCYIPHLSMDLLAIEGVSDN